MTAKDSSMTKEGQPTQSAGNAATAPLEPCPCIGLCICHEPCEFCDDAGIVEREIVRGGITLDAPVYCGCAVGQKLSGNR